MRVRAARMWITGGRIPPLLSGAVPETGLSFSAFTLAIRAAKPSIKFGATKEQEGAMGSFIL